jgi:hypothetical protein
MNQIAKILEIMGTPSNEDLAAMPECREWIQSLGCHPPISINSLFPNVSDAPSMWK